MFWVEKNPQTASLSHSVPSYKCDSLTLSVAKKQLKSSTCCGDYFIPLRLLFKSTFFTRFPLYIYIYICIFYFLVFSYFITLGFAFTITTSASCYLYLHTQLPLTVLGLCMNVNNSRALEQHICG